ncbi:MAG: hypothetical protein ACREOO_03685 [bacterium]
MNHQAQRRVAVVHFALILALTILFHAGIARAQKFDFTVDPTTIRCGEYDDIQAIIWYGNDARMTLEKLAAYCAQVLWFSPDEPLLHGGQGEEIMIPEPFPFEDSTNAPVVYYRVRDILERVDAKAYEPDTNARGSAIIDLKNVAGINLDFFFYYPSEAGLGGHKHDVEFAEFQLVIWRRDSCETSRYHLIVSKVIGKAHGMQWYDDTLGVDEFTRFPMHLLGVFPFFIVKNLEEPMAGGFVTHRVILKDDDLRDISWMLHYTPSASRWIDTYFSAGAEWDKEPAPEGSEKKLTTKTEFVLETGIKFRVNMTHSPLKFMTKLTDFWGARFGVKNNGFFDINKLRYVIEFGAGTW